MKFCSKKIFIALSLIFLMFFSCVIISADSVTSKEKIYMKYVSNVEPYHIHNDEGYSGFEIDYIKELFEDSKYEVVITDSVDKSMSDDLVYFRADKYRGNENGFFDHSGKVYARTYKAFTLKERDFDELSFDSMKNCRIGILNTGYFLGAEFDKSNEVVPFLSSLEGIDALLNNEIDVWYGDVSVANYIFIKENTVQKIKYHDNISEEISIYLYYHVGRNDLGTFINNRIKQLRKNGEFEELFLDYFYKHSTYYVEQQTRTSNIFKTAVIVLVLLIISSFSFVKIRKIYLKNKYSKTLASSILNYGNRYVILWKSDYTYFEINSYFKKVFETKSEINPPDLKLMFASIKTNLLHNTSSPLSDEEVKSIINNDNVLTTLVDINGDDREILWTTINIDDNSKAKTLISIGSDVTEKNKLRRELQFSETRYQIAMQSAEIALIYICDDGSVTYLSDVGYRILNFRRSDRINIDVILNRIHQADRKIFEDAILKCDINNGIKVSNCEVRVLSSDDEYKWMSFKFKLLLDFSGREGIKDGVNIVGAFFDVDREKKKDIKIERLAFQDELTGIYNRYKFLSIVNDSVKKAEETERRCAVITFNLDRFHRFNDLYGVEVGDKILKSVANIIKYNPYGKDCSAARLGGDEFACMVWLESDGDHIEEYVKELSERISDYASYEYDEMKLTISAGACIYPDNVQNSNDIFERAIFSMRIAKSDRSMLCQIYNNSIKDIIIKHEILEKELQEAVDKKQFEIYYQPKVNAITEKIVGAEALIRWNHPERGVVSPNEFIPVAEEIGIISEIGKWTLKTACRQNMKWQKMGLPKLKISVNVSAIEFYQTDIVGLVKNTLLETDLEPECLELELTESMALMDIEETITKMNSIRELGVGISIDDFGTGYSSLSNIQNLPIDELKLDKSFIDKMLNDTRTKSIIATIIDLSKIIGLDIVAEGVEEESQFSILKEMECTIIQGYLFSKPLKVDKFVELVKKNYELGEYQKK